MRMYVARTPFRKAKRFYDAFTVPWHPTTRNGPRSQHPPLSLFVPRFYIQLRTSRATKNHDDATLYLFALRFYIHFPLSSHAPSPPPLTLARGVDEQVWNLLESSRTSRPRICLRENCKYSDDPPTSTSNTCAVSLSAAGTVRGEGLWKLERQTRRRSSYQTIQSTHLAGPSVVLVAMLWFLLRRCWSPKTCT
jgi:hypothetical protein